jgi:hypothetical protein
VYRPYGVVVEAVSFINVVVEAVYGKREVYVYDSTTPQFEFKRTIPVSGDGDERKPEQVNLTNK